MLFLTGSVVGVFTAQDLLLFYAFFEAMLIPLYVLIGVWGGAGRLRRDDHVRRLHGRRLAADAGRDHRLRPPAGHVRPDDDGARARTTGSSSASRSPSRSRRRSARSTAGCPIAYRESPPEVSGVLSGVDLEGRAVYGFLRIAIAKFPRPAHDFRGTDPRARVDRARLRLAARVPRARRPRRRRVLVARADGPDRASASSRSTASASTAPCCRWSTTALLSMSLFLLAGHGRAAHVDGRALAPRRHGARPPGARDES